MARLKLIVSIIWSWAPPISSTWWLWSKGTLIVSILLSHQDTYITTVQIIFPHQVVFLIVIYSIINIIRSLLTLSIFQYYQTKSFFKSDLSHVLPSQLLIFLPQYIIMTYMLHSSTQDHIYCFFLYLFYRFTMNTGGMMKLVQSLIPSQDWFKPKIGLIISCISN